MEEAPLFSVLIANYNNGCYLQEAVDSIQRQSYSNWEIVIVDDCSTDNSAELYKVLANNPKIHVFCNEKNRGAGYTKRRCVELAQGEICGFVDPDDVLVGDDVFDVMVKKHLEYPLASMVYSGMYRGDTTLNIVSTTPGETIDQDSSALETRSWPFHHFVSFKRSAYMKTDGIDPDMKRAVDYDMYYKLEEVGDVVHIDCIQYIQRNNPHSISLNSNSYKAAVWHSYACVRAMTRRGKTDESLMLFPVEHALKKAYYNGYEKAVSSKIYRLGRLLASPALWLAKLWKR